MSMTNTLDDYVDFAVAALTAALREFTPELQRDIFCRVVMKLQRPPTDDELLCGQGDPSAVARRQFRDLMVLKASRDV